MKRIIIVIISVMATLSCFYGLISLSRIGFDFQIDNAKILLAKNSPYEIYLKNQYFIRFKRIPTILPQGFYLLIPFTFPGDFFGALLYGIIGIILLYICRFLKKNSENFNILFFLLLSTEPYRSNLSLGQPLFFYFPLFIIFDYCMKNKNTKIYNLLITPFLLMLICVKPSLSLWIPFYYGFNQRNLLIYVATFIFQLLIIFLFSLHTKTTVFSFFKSYFQIVIEHMKIHSHPNSIFSINFSTFLQSINSIMIISIIFIILLLLLWKYMKKIKISEYQFMYILILLSLIPLYHPNADIFILLLPFFVYNVDILNKENFMFLIFIIFLIIEKFIFLFITGLTEKIIVNFFTIGINLLICYKILYKRFK